MAQCLQSCVACVLGYSLMSTCTPFSDNSTDEIVLPQNVKIPSQVKMSCTLSYQRPCRAGWLTNSKTGAARVKHTNPS